MKIIRCDTGEEKVFATITKGILDVYENKMKTYEISSGFFDPFRLTIDEKGLVFWCSDNSHPVGAKWESLKAYYEAKKGKQKCKIKEIK